MNLSGVPCRQYFSNTVCMLLRSHPNQQINSAWTQIWEAFVESILSTGQSARHHGEFRDGMLEHGKERKCTEETDPTKLGQEVGGAHGKGPWPGWIYWRKQILSLRALHLNGTHPGSNLVICFCKICKRKIFWYFKHSGLSPLSSVSPTLSWWCSPQVGLY